jgi:Xaa-Pro dipeptidase
VIPIPGPADGPGLPLSASRVPAPPVIDVTRMHAERLARARQGLRKHGLAAALLFDPMNVRYTITSGLATVCNLHLSFRWALVPAESEPILWEYDNSMHIEGDDDSWTGERRPCDMWTFFGAGSNTVRDANAFADEIADVLRERALLGELLGVDRLETVGYLALQRAGIQIADAQPAIEEARAVKTADELEIIRRNGRVCDLAIDELRAVMRPGITENELWGTFIGAALKMGAEWCETRLLSSGPRTNPWLQEATNRVVQEGDFVGFDTDLVGEYGYLIDISRTYLCGDRAATSEQRRLHDIAYNYVYDNMPEFRPGASFRELGERLGPRLPDEFQTLRYAQIAHGSGMVDEYPCIKFEDNHDGEVEAGMVLSVEAYAGAAGGHEGVKLEEQIIVTEDGFEMISHAPFDDRLMG